MVAAHGRAREHLAHEQEGEGDRDRCQEGGEQPHEKQAIQDVGRARQPVGDHLEDVVQRLVVDRRRPRASRLVVHPRLLAPLEDPGIPGVPARPILDVPGHGSDGLGELRGVEAVSLRGAARELAPFADVLDVAEVVDLVGDLERGRDDGPQGAVRERDRRAGPAGQRQPAQRAAQWARWLPPNRQRDRARANGADEREHHPESPRSRRSWLCSPRSAGRPGERRTTRVGRPGRNQSRRITSVPSRLGAA